MSKLAQSCIITGNSTLLCRMLVHPYLMTTLHKARAAVRAGLEASFCVHLLYRDEFRRLTRATPVSCEIIRYLFASEIWNSSRRIIKRNTCVVIRHDIYITARRYISVRDSHSHNFWYSLIFSQLYVVVVMYGDVSCNLYVFMWRYSLCVITLACEVSSSINIKVLELNVLFLMWWRRST